MSQESFPASLAVPVFIAGGCFLESFSSSALLDRFFCCVLSFALAGIGYRFSLFSFLFPMNSSIETVRSFARCPVCNKRYAPASVTPVIEGESRSVVHVLCVSCRVSSILFISENQWGIASIGVLTDLDGDELRRRFGAEPVSMNDVIEAYTSLKKPTEKLADIS